MALIKLANAEAFAIVDDDLHSDLVRKDWYLSDSGYARRKENGIDVYMHTVVCPSPDGMFTDHRDGNRLNNRRGNLRPATNQENQRNARKRKGGTSRFKGVYLVKATGKYMTRIVVDGQSIYLGTCGDEIEAAQRYNDAAREHFGEFARLNEVGPVSVAA